MATSKNEFENLIKEHEKDIYSICYMYARNEDDAKDLRQESLLNLWNGFPRFRGESSTKTWVTRVTINTCISFKRKKRPSTLDESFIPEKSNASQESGAGIKMLHSRLQKLDYLDRAIVLLWLENLSYDEIGAIVGMPVKNVSVRLVRIKEKLKKINENK